VAGVDHDPHPLHGEARLGDVGGQHHLAEGGFGGGEGEILLLGRERPVQDPYVREDVDQPLLDPADLCHTGQEDQHVAFRLVERPTDDGGDVVLGVAAAGRWRCPADVDGMGRGGRLDDRGASQQFGHRSRLDRGGHRQELEVGPQLPATVERQCQAQVGLEIAFVELIEDDDVGPGEFRVRLEPAGEDAFGDHLDAGAATRRPIVAGDISHGVPDRLTQQRRHPARRRPGRQAPRLQHQDLAGNGVEQPQRNHRGLA
jgi:hypothetical protein